jgi:hypothetical protein
MTAKNRHVGYRHALSQDFRILTILKPCKFAVQPAVTAGQPRTVRVPGTCTREAGFDRALVKDSVGTYQKDGQDRALPGL